MTLDYSSVQALDDLRGRATVSVEEAGRVLGIGRFVAYREANRYLETEGARGLPCLRFGGRIVVPVPKLKAMLGLEADREPQP